MEKDLTPIQQFAFQASKTCTIFNIRKASRLIGQFYDQAFSPLGIRSTQFSMLLAIAYEDVATINRLSQIMGMDRTTLSRNVQILNKNGLAAINKGHDRREQLISLTSAGKDLLERAIPVWEATQNEFRLRFGENQSQQLLDQLQEFIKKWG